MAEDFTEEQFDDELPIDVEVEPRVEPRKIRTAPKPKPVPTAAEVPEERFGAFAIPTRVGVLDRETGQPLGEDGEVSNGLLLGLITKLLNDVDEIKKSL